MNDITQELESHGNHNSKLVQDYGFFTSCKKYNANKSKTIEENRSDPGGISTLFYIFMRYDEIVNFINLYEFSPNLLSKKHIGMGVFYSSFKILEYLKDNGIDLSDENYFMIAIKSNSINSKSPDHLSIIKLLVEAGADPFVHSNLALCAAANFDSSIILEYLLSLGADPNARASAPLRIAISGRSYSSIFLLLDAGANIYVGDLLSQFICLTLQSSVFNKILSYNPDLSSLSRLALKCTIRDQNMETIRLMMGLGADFSKLNDEPVKEFDDKFQFLCEAGLNVTSIMSVFKGT